jgi:tetratricopeptide (TPR) repeat protein
MKNLILLALLLCFSVNIQAQNPEIENLNKQLESHKRTNPDSAKYYMFRLLRYSSEMHDTVVGKMYSTIGIQYNKLAVPDSAEFYMKKALEYNKNYPFARARAYLNLAINYRIGSFYKESLAAADSAIVFYNKANNKEGVGLAYGEIASNYNYMVDSEKALEYLKKAIPILTNAGNKRDLYVVKQKLANLYYNNGNYAFAKDLYEEVLPFFAKEKGANYYVTLLSYSDCLLKLEENYKGAEEALKEAEKGFLAINQKEYMLIATGSLAQVYSVSGDTQKAQKAFQNAFEGLYLLNSPRFMEISERYLEFLNNQKQYDTALNVIKRVKEASKSSSLKMNANNEIGFLKQTIATYSQKGLVANSLESFERIDFLNDSLNTVINQAKSRELREAYQNELQREKNLVLTKNNELLVENNSTKDRILILSIVSLFLIVIIGFVLFRSNRNKLKLQHELVASLENSKNVLEEKNTLESELGVERERTLANKERELVEVSLEMSDLQNRIIEILDNRENPESSQVLAIKLKDLLGQNNYWKYFKGKFVEVHPIFASQLSQMFPNLSESEIAFCCMLKLQLSTQEIASLMGISPELVESKTANLRRKIGMEDNIFAFEKMIDHLE